VTVIKKNLLKSFLKPFRPGSDNGSFVR
jgi:hypothetical protein